MMLRRLSFLGAMLAVIGVAQADSFPSSRQAADGSYRVPIYINPSVYGPSKYHIYVGIDGGPMLPYLFDTGAPYFMSLVGGPGGTPTANFSFGDGYLTYSYFPEATVVRFGEQGKAQAIVSTRKMNVARVAQINGATAPTGPLADGTYGDFGAGLYGTSALATALTQVPLAEGLKVGYVVDLAGKNAGSGVLTLGLSPLMVANMRNSPGAITMPMSRSGVRIPAATRLIPGYNKAQVADTQVTFIHHDVNHALPLPTVFDTGGGPNSIIYDSGFGNITPTSLAITYNGRTVVQAGAVTPWGGTPLVIDTTFGGPRVNPGGWIFQQNVIMFDVEDGALTIVPASGTSPATFPPARTITVVALGNGRYELSGRLTDSNRLQAAGVLVLEGSKSKMYRARVRGNGWVVTGVQPFFLKSTLEFELHILDKQGQTTWRKYRVNL
ncbi:MAG TPA: hypothetical protein VIM48_00510 [Chthoniobacterales bacterium]